MEAKQFHRRVWAVAVLIGIIFLCMGGVLFDLQINRGDEFYLRSQYKIAETRTVEAARGRILDRNGRVLVSNRTTYRVLLNPKQMGKEQNEVLFSLLEIARKSGIPWHDTLPVSEEPPFVYTLDSPFRTDDGDEPRLTRLGELAVHMKWIRDPMESRGADSVSAQSLLEQMCDSFGLLKEMERTPEEIRAAAGLRYELCLRENNFAPIPYVFAQEVDIGFITRVKEAGLSGVILEPVSVRQYETPYAAHLLGRVGPIYREEWETYKVMDTDGDGVPDYQMDDIVGKDGAEKAFESRLRGRPGVQTVERSVNGKEVSSEWLTPPRPGENVMLTLDIGLQAKVEETLASEVPQLPSRDTEGAACVILDVDSAEVLAAASYPSFSLATFSEDYMKNRGDPLKPLFNRALQGTYPPGSTFKMVTAVGGLEEGVISPSTIINTKGKYTYYPGTAPRCWLYREYGRVHGPINVSRALEVSCNYFFFDVGRRLGIDLLDEYAALFGLGQKTGVELYEERGVMAGPAFTESLGGTWYEGNVLSAAIGQESSQFTPIQLANYVATLVNGGTRHAAHFLKETSSHDFSETVEECRPEVLSSIEIRPENLKAVKAGMLALTQKGSVSRYFRGLDVKVGAKTGSAQVSSEKESNAVFVCFAPYDDPEIALALVVEHGGGGSDLGGIAAEILSYYFAAQEEGDRLPPENTLLP